MLTCKWPWGKRTDHTSHYIHPPWRVPVQETRVWNIVSSFNLAKSHGYRLTRTRGMGDMIITGRSPVERLENLEQVLKRLERYGLKATKKRLSLWKTVLNFVVDAEGPQNTSKKIEAVLTPPPPNRNMCRNWEHSCDLSITMHMVASSKTCHFTQLHCTTFLKRIFKFIWSK